jgi:hypothetical protein
MAMKIQILEMAGNDFWLVKKAALCSKLLETSEAVTESENIFQPQ